MNYDNRNDIEFRGKSVATGEWVYGSSAFYQNSKHTASIIQFLDTDNSTRRNFRFCEVIPETIEQYTGEKDKQGRDIYEIPEKMKKALNHNNEMDSLYKEAKNEK